MKTCENLLILVKTCETSKKCSKLIKTSKTHSVTDGPMDRQTDGPTDRPTDRVTYRVTCTQLKIVGPLESVRSDGLTNRMTYRVPCSEFSNQHKDRYTDKQKERTLQQFNDL